MILFVLLWGSAAIFTRWGLDNASVFLLLLWRYGVAFAGLVLIVFKGIDPTTMSMLGIWYAIGALLCITIGTLMQKRIAQKPQRILPLQYAITIVICLLFLPTEEIYSTFSLGFWVPALCWCLNAVSFNHRFYKVVKESPRISVLGLFSQ
ncbi:MAG TPA: hypothetical protein H9889_09685, partial [Candidatus Ignatzschineria merdigallinarum]|nr:hypothetical protein [Candidatus Ignatzschineria merdigallinarum]